MTITNLTNTRWYFNETIDSSICTDFVHIPDGYDGVFLIDFISNNMDRTGLLAQIGSGSNDELYYTFNGEDEIPVYSFGGTWYDEAYRTITITGGEDVENAELIAWLEANATQLDMDNPEDPGPGPEDDDDGDPPIVDLTNTRWYFKELLDNCGISNEWFPHGSGCAARFNVNFIVDNVNCYELFYELGDLGTSAYGGGVMYQADDAIIEAYNDFPDEEGWFEESYRDITITGGDDATNPDLITWIKANAIQLPIEDADDPEEPEVTKPSATFDLSTLNLPTGIHTVYVTLSAEGYRDSEPSNEVVYEVAEVGYLTFSSPNSFTLKTNNSAKNWDGTLEYSTDTSTWDVWDGTTTLSADDGELYLRGIGNTKITGSSSGQWVLTGSNISCDGNIENLLDYATVVNGNHPTMAEKCYRDMFCDCTSLVSAPVLPATTVTEYCYYWMFQNCSSLVSAPALPATTLARECYSHMFDGCTSLTSAPALPAITLEQSCYSYMFSKCTNLVNAPVISAEVAKKNCCYGMFQNCTSLTSAPALPATTLAEECYHGMFDGCTSLTSAPVLPATTLAESCYESMFSGCRSLTSAPALPATTLAPACYESMFRSCTSLTSAPVLPATTLAIACYYWMFYYCTSLASLPALPATTLAEECCHGMFQNCTTIKLSKTKTEEYCNEYRIPVSGEATIAKNALMYMFLSTGGAFAGTPSINTTYYTSNTIVY